MTLLLAPAGTREMAFTVIDEGADALYMGPMGWSRRTHESEMKDTEIGEVIDYARHRNKEVRVLLNTFPSPLEIDHYQYEIDKYVDMGATGFIISDIGAIAMIRKSLPEAIIHISIGSGITNVRDVCFYEQAGADMIVLPYRWGIPEIKRIREVSKIGLEAFLFETIQTGKICPGKCIMSSYLKSRDWMDIEEKDYSFGSANRGSKECYRVCQTAWEFDMAGAEPVSIKLRRDAELMLEQVPEYIGMGVEYFKLAGRERSTEVVRTLVRFYRKVMDGIVDGTQTDMSAYLPELIRLREMWVSAKRQRLDVLLDRASSYQS
jgi:putative protease